MKAYILDASVAAKWFLPVAGETLVDEAHAVLDDYANGRTLLSVPDLFWPEFGNILWKAARIGRIPAATAGDAIASITEQNISTAPSQPLLKDAFAIAAAFERSVYDCIYVALAIASGKPLLTADERLANALAARFPIRWLGSL